jgi:hypothetical protein
MHIDAIVWVFIASLLIWGAFFAYLVATDRRLRRVEEKLKAEELR